MIVNKSKPSKKAPSRDVRLEETGFRRLVSGESVELKTTDGKEVHVILADIGWGRIFAAVEGARPQQPARHEAARTTTPRPRGRPPLPADEAKLAPVVIRTTKALRDELQKVAQASGRSLTREIEARLARSLWEDRDKGPAELRLDILARQLMDLVRACWANPDTGAVDAPPYLLFNKEVLAEHGLTVETTGTAVPEAKPKSKPKSRGAAPRSEDAADSVTPASRNTGGSDGA
jgi:hypothetical protein